MPSLRTRMVARDLAEPHRVSSPLELLFDLTFVIAYGTAASQLAHSLAAGHVGVGIAGFGFASFAIAWAWINFAWFASAYDTDDWAFRLLTLVQMIGVLILALGLPTSLLVDPHGCRIGVVEGPAEWDSDDAKALIKAAEGA